MSFRQHVETIYRNECQKVGLNFNNLEVIEVIDNTFPISEKIIFKFVQNGQINEIRLDLNFFRNIQPYICTMIPCYQIPNLSLQDTSNICSQLNLIHHSVVNNITNIYSQLYP